MDESLALLIVAVVLVVAFVWWLLQLVSAVRTPRRVWEAAGQNQLVHVLLMIFLGVVGAVVYAVVARPQLRRVEEDSRGTRSA